MIFSLYNKIIDFNNYVRKYLVINIPNIHRDKGSIRMKYLTKMKVNISLIDMLITDINNLKCQKSKYINTSINKLEDIKNIIYGWIFNEEDL